MRSELTEKWLNPRQMVGRFGIGLVLVRSSDDGQALGPVHVILWWPKLDELLCAMERKASKVRERERERERATGATWHTLSGGF